MISHIFIPTNYDARANLPDGAVEAREASRKAREASTQVDLLKRDVNRLLMITEALWLLLQKAHGYTDDELRALITQIDLRDGRLDGRVKETETLLCPACKRPVSYKYNACIYCGQLMEQDPFGR